MSKGSEAVKHWRRRFRLKVIDAMGGKCSCCGYNKCDKGLDLHHIDPNSKDFSFGDRRADPVAIMSLMPELKKCVLVCKLCHLEIHEGLRECPNNTSFNEQIFIAAASQVQPRNGKRFASLPPYERMSI